MFFLDPIHGTLTIELLNLQTNPKDVSQLISGIEFTMSNLSAGTVANATPSATESAITINGDGVPTSTPETSGWVDQSIGANTFTLCTVCGSGVGGHPAGPSQLIIGGPNSSTGSLEKYTNANGSIAHNGPHNPFILGSGDTYASGPLAGLDSSPEWVLNLPLLTPTSTVTQVKFFFGTTYGDHVITETVSTQTSSATPEPGPLVLMISGLGLIAGSVLVRRRQPRP